MLIYWFVAVFMITIICCCVGMWICIYKEAKYDTAYDSYVGELELKNNILEAVINELKEKEL